MENRAIATHVGWVERQRNPTTLILLLGYPAGSCYVPQPNLQNLIRFIRISVP